MCGAVEGYDSGEADVDGGGEEGWCNSQTNQVSSSSLGFC